MAHARRRFGALGAGIATLGLVLTASSMPTNANPPAPGYRTFGAPAERLVTIPHRLRPRIRSHYIVAPGSCSSNYAGVGYSFLGVTLGSNIAGGEYSAVPGGNENESCDDSSTIGAGLANVIATPSTSTVGGSYSFIGAGVSNVITDAYSAFVGAGELNEAANPDAFVGAGANGTAEAPGSFVGAGGYEYTQQLNPQPGGGNTADGIDSFIGAGDLNQIASNGTGSFIGGGGTLDLSGGARNTISAADSFIGAGDNSAVSGFDSFLGAGTGGKISGNYAGIAAGYADTVSGAAAFAGAGGFNLASGQDAFVGAGNANTSSGQGSFVGAGGTLGSNTGNLASGQDSFIGGGDHNVAKGVESVIAGGNGNTVGAGYGFAGSGLNNSIGSAALFAVIAGGQSNTALGFGSMVGGGGSNAARGTYATIPGGYENAADGIGSFAAGTLAKARNAGAFVWNDNSTPNELQSTVNDQFLARASGGFYLYSNSAATVGVKLARNSGTWASLSDRTMKSNVVPLDDAAVLSKVASLPISEWSYKTEGGVRHVGPMAQDFYAAFKVGEDDRHITSIDEDGVALAAIKALQRENDSLRMRLARDEARNAHDAPLLAALAKDVEMLKHRARR